MPFRRTTHQQSRANIAVPTACAPPPLSSRAPARWRAPGISLLRRPAVPCETHATRASLGTSAGGADNLQRSRARCQLGGITEQRRSQLTPLITGNRIRDRSYAGMVNDSAAGPFIRLEKLIGDRAGVIRYTPHFDTEGAPVLAHACRLGAEGIVSKARTGRYRS